MESLGQPNDEEAILGMAMFDEGARRKMLGALQRENFRDAERQTVFALIAAEHSEGRSCEPAKLNSAHGNGDIAMTLCDLDCKRPISLEPDFFINRILERDWYQRFAMEARKLAQTAQTTREVDLSALEKAHREKPTATGKGLENPLLMEIAIDDLEGRILDHQQGRKSYLSTGWGQLDGAIGGWKHGTFSVLAGRPGAGKTSLALHFALNALRQNTTTLFCSWEMTEKELLRKLLAAEGRIPLRKIDQGTVSDEEMDRYARAVEQFKNYPFVVFNALPNIDDVCAEIRRYHQRRNARLVFVDYLGLIQTTTRHNSKREEMIEITRKMKALALELQIPIVGLAQLRRLSQPNGKDRAPSKDDLKESGSLEEDADNVLLLWRKEDDKSGKVQNFMIVAKARHGSEAKIEYHADFSKNQFEEMT